MKLDDFITSLTDEDQELSRELKITEIKYMFIEKIHGFIRMRNMSNAQAATIFGVDEKRLDEFIKGDYDAPLSFISRILYYVDQLN